MYVLYSRVHTCKTFRAARLLAFVNKVFVSHGGISTRIAGMLGALCFIEIQHPPTLSLEDLASYRYDTRDVITR